ncbi:MAG: C_GCAxxG_C_C family protein [Clostridia bacterium]|nr:C_GCAxxG_C_C family protein [Clostridia bacterium]
MQELSRREQAMKNFTDGYNCTQSVVLAFEDMLPLGHEELALISSSFGGGMARLREVCGCVSGMFMVAGLLYGYSSPEDKDGKIRHYSELQALAKKFEDFNGSIVCRDLLKLVAKHDTPIPDERTAEYYKKRPCAVIIGHAAELLEEYINQKNG